jgi:hypothetical protein
MKTYIPYSLKQGSFADTYPIIRQPIYRANRSLSIVFLPNSADFFLLPSACRAGLDGRDHSYHPAADEVNEPLFRPYH